MITWIEWLKVGFGLWAVVQSFSYALTHIRQKNYIGGLLILFLCILACFILVANYYRRYI